MASAEGQVAKVRSAAQLPLQTHRHTPLQLIPAEVQFLEFRKVPQLSRQLPAQVVVAEVQKCQVGEAAQLPRYLPAQGVEAEVQ